MRRATAPDGKQWGVRRLWLPRLRWRPRFGRVDETDGALIGAGVDDLGDLIFAIVLFVLIFVVGVFVLPYIVLALEFVVLPLVLLLRIVLRRPFTVQAKSGSDVRRWKVVGWRASGEAVDEVARALEQGREPMIDARVFVSAA